MTHTYRYAEFTIKKLYNMLANDQSLHSFPIK